MKGVVVHGILALGGLILAYMVWTDDEPTTREEQVTVFECEPERLQEIRYVTKGQNVLIKRRGSGDSRAWWVTHNRRPEQGEATTEEYVAGEGIDEYIALLTPFLAKRDLGEDLDNDVLEEIELHRGGTRLTVKCGSEYNFRVGGTAYGTGDRYLRLGRGHVYLVDARVLRDIDAPSSLMQRELHTFEQTEVEYLVIHAFDRELRLKQRNRHDPRAAEWVDAQHPDQRNEIYGNWLARVSRLRVQNYLAPDAQPGSDIEGESVERLPLVTLTYMDEDEDELGEVEIVRVNASDGPQYYARSEATRSWVKLLQSLGRMVERDLRPIVGLEEVVEEEPAPAGPDGGATAPDGGPPDAGTATAPTEPSPPGLPPGHPSPSPLREGPAPPSMEGARETPAPPRGGGAVSPTPTAPPPGPGHEDHGHP